MIVWSGFIIRSLCNRKRGAKHPLRKRVCGRFRDTEPPANPHKHKKKAPIFRWMLSGGDKRDRTADLLNAIQALSQLSYTPMWKVPNAPDLYRSDWLLI